jgi:L-serine dehydratase
MVNCRAEGGKPVDSLRELYRIGVGPSSSHTMAPRRAAEIFLSKCPDAASYRVTLYGSLAATGKGHLTDSAVGSVLAPRPVEIVWKPGETLPQHPNAMRFQGLGAGGRVVAEWTVFSVGGGAIREAGEAAPAGKSIYELRTMDSLLAWCRTNGTPLWRYVELCEGPAIWPFLGEVWGAMRSAVERGLAAEGPLPGVLRLPRKSHAYHVRARQLDASLRRTALLAAFAVAVSEENAGGGVIVTAPTCGACGTLPGVLRFLAETEPVSEQDILRALATAGLVGNLIKFNGSISGAEVGCQGEVGSACAMAAAAATQLMGGSPRQIEYAAEMGIEHHLGLTCDPVAGLVQIPCIERNAFAATRALDAAVYALLSDGEHRISFDDVVRTMAETGRDLQVGYRETATAGLARLSSAASRGGSQGI